MKAVFITFDQAHKDDVIRILDRFLIRGFTLLDATQGRGTKSGEPHYGSHAWPSLNNSILTVVENEKTSLIKKAVEELDKQSPMLGIRLFVWNIEDMY
jgi:hypothetical protein